MELADYRRKVQALVASGNLDDAPLDLETYRIPNGFLIAGIVWWAVTIPFVQPGLFGREGSFFQPSTLLLDTGVSTLSGLLGGFLIAGIMLLMALVFDKVSGKESLGGGDIKLLFVVGLYLGFACSFFNLILSCILGLVFVAAMKKKRIPFGPAISLAAYVTLLIGSFVINWYIGLF